MPPRPILNLNEPGPYKSASFFETGASLRPDAVERSVQCGKMRREEIFLQSKPQNITKKNREMTVEMAQKSVLFPGTLAIPRTPDNPRTMSMEVRLYRFFWITRYEMHYFPM